MSSMLKETLNHTTMVIFSKDETEGLLYGIDLSIDKKRYKQIGIKPTIKMQYEVYDLYDSIVSSNDFTHSANFLRTMPCIYVTYNF